MTGWVVPSELGRAPRCRSSSHTASPTPATSTSASGSGPAPRRKGFLLQSSPSSRPVPPSQAISTLQLTGVSECHRHLHDVVETTGCSRSKTFIASSTAADTPLILQYPNKKAITHGHNAGNQYNESFCQLFLVVSEVIGRHVSPSENGCRACSLYWCPPLPAHRLPLFEYAQSRLVFAQGLSLPRPAYLNPT